jgi:ParB-like chromosome segregation protein Spo0J
MEKVFWKTDVPAFVEMIEKAGYPERIYWFDPFAVKMHPKNMRRMYPDREVKQLAHSIAARGRVLQNLTAVVQEGAIYVVIGNKRMLAARSLSDDGGTIPLPVAVRPSSELDQLLDMVAENVVRSRPDPISEGLHYRRLREEEGLTVSDICRLTGVSSDTIKTRLDMLRLGEPAQQLMMTGKLPRGKDVVRALLTLPTDVQAKAAEGFAKSRATPKVIKTVCARLRREAERKQKALDAERKGEAFAPALDENGGHAVWDGLLSWEEIQQAFSRACEGCTARPPAWLLVESGLPRQEPLWAEVEKAAEGVCDTCGLKTIERLCGQCPVIEFVRRLKLAVDRRLRSGS